jgi:hypothetical protein
VSGGFRLQLRGSRDAVEVPLSHIWWFAIRRVKEVRNLSKGLELRRLPAAGSCAS